MLTAHYQDPLGVFLESAVFVADYGAALFGDMAFGVYEHKLPWVFQQSSKVRLWDEGVERWRTGCSGGSGVCRQGSGGRGVRAQVAVGFPAVVQGTEAGFRGLCRQGHGYAGRGQVAGAFGLYEHKLPWVFQQSSKVRIVFIWSRGWGLRGSGGRQVGYRVQGSGVCRQVAGARGVRAQVAVGFPVDI